MDPATLSLLTSTGGALAQGIGSFFGNQAQSDAASQAAAAYQQQAQQAQQFQQGVYNNAQTNLNPYVQAGQGALPSLQNAISNYTQAQLPTTAAPFTESNWQDPGYTFRQQQANDAINAATASKGMTLGSGALKSLQTRNQDMASQEYQNSFQRNLASNQQNFGQQQQNYTNQMGYQNQNISNLGSLAGVGSGAASTEAQVGNQASNNMTGILTGLGNTLAKSQTAQGAATGNMWQNFGNLLGGSNGILQNLGSYFGGSAPGQ